MVRDGAPRAPPHNEVSAAHTLLTIKSVNRSAIRGRGGFADAGSALVIIAAVGACSGGMLAHLADLHGLRPEHRPTIYDDSDAAGCLPAVLARLRALRPAEWRGLCASRSGAAKLRADDGSKSAE